MEAATGSWRLAADLAIKVSQAAAEKRGVVEAEDSVVVAVVV